jgi:signal transduction histidine kinase
LKTPLALIRAQIELRKDNGSERDSLLSDVAYMTRQVQQLLLLAEASEPRNYTFSVIGVPALAHAVVTYLQRMAESADVHVMVSTAAEDVTWTADEGAMYTC